MATIQFNLERMSRSELFDAIKLVLTLGKARGLNRLTGPEEACIHLSASSETWKRLMEQFTDEEWPLPREMPPTLAGYPAHSYDAHEPGDVHFVLRYPADDPFDLILTIPMETHP